MDSLLFLHETHNYIRAQLGKEPISLDDFKGYFGAPRDKLYMAMYGKDNIEKAKTIFVEYVRANHLDGALKPLSNADKAIKAAAGLGVPMGVVSNKLASLIHAEVRQFGWSGHFKTIVGAGDADEGKPSPKPLLLALDRLGLRPSNDIWLVGDTDNDIECAVAAECACVYLGQENKPNARFSCGNLLEFRKVLLALS